MWGKAQSKVKNALAMVDKVQKYIDAAVWLAGIFVPRFFVNSSTMRVWVITGALSGGIVGYFVTTSRWGGKARTDCLKASKRYAIRAVFALVGLVFLFAVLKPEFVSKCAALITINELLLRIAFLPNLLAALLWGATVGLAVAAVTLHSKRLCTAAP